ncbi:MAG TPA: DUF6448 family protein [Ignavibacteriaceae bacterium]|nr:DUF6448 family protein [Ignavibacteriaceae bacterium]
MRKTKLVGLFTFIILITFFAFTNLSAHCDGIDGPVVKAAKKALEENNINYALIWVKKEHEDAIKKSFENTLKVRVLSPDAKELADMYFFETLVRLHRQGEGEMYAGLKPSGTDIGKAIPAADEAIENNDIHKLHGIVPTKDMKEVEGLFNKVMSKKNFDVNNVEVGREYVEAYVKFIHKVEVTSTGKEEEHKEKHVH